MDADSYLQNLVQLGVIKRPKGRPAALKEHTLRIRITDVQLERLETFAQEHGLSMSDVIRNYINRLPKPKNNNKTDV